MGLLGKCPIGKDSEILALVENLHVQTICARNVKLIKVNKRLLNTISEVLITV